MHPAKRMRFSIRTHRVLAAVWAVTIIPSMLWWSDSVLWVQVMSIYAISVAHWAAGNSARAEDAARDDT
jgi:hypothetical protein